MSSTSSSAGTRTPHATSPRRDVAFDLVRGFCIVSMVLAHLAPGHLVTGLWHSVPFFDGLSGFVLLSGLVLGMVQRRRWEASGLAVVQRHGVQRLWVVLQGHLALMALTLLVGLTGGEENLVRLPDDLGPGAWLTAALSGTIVPLEASVLRLYVVLLLAALGAYWLLGRGLAAVLALGSLALAASGWAWSWLTAAEPLVALHYDATTASFTGWQAVFFLPMVLGWYWRDLDVAGRVAARPIVVAVAGAGLVLLVRAAAGTLDPGTAGALMSKYDAGPGRLVVAFAAVAMLYGGAVAAMRWVPAAAFRPLEMVGRRSLDSYLIHAVVVIAVEANVAVAYEHPLGVLPAVLTLLVCWGWAELRAAAGGGPRDALRLLVRRPAATAA